MAEAVFDFFAALDVDDLLDVGDQTALSVGDYGPGFGVEPTRWSRRVQEVLDEAGYPPATFTVDETHHWPASADTGDTP